MTHLKVLVHEIRMNVLELKAYRFSFFIDIAIFFGIYSFLIISNSGYKLSIYYTNEVTSKELILLAYAMWILSISAINTVCGEIRQENIKGTLEQKFMAVVSFQWLLVGKIISSLLIQIVEVAIVLVLSLMLFDFAIQVNLLILLFMFITFLGMYGFALIIGSIVINKKKIGQMNLIIQLGLIVLSDVFTLSDISFISRLIPLSIGNHIIRLSYTGMSIPVKDIFLFVIVCTLWFIAGLVLFDKSIQNVKVNGSLSVY